MILDKAKIAHDWAIARLASGAGFMTSEIVEDSWKYADLMQAEADKREKEEAAQKRKEIREMLNAPNTFVEREGQHFDDVASVCNTYSSPKEWQPDEIPKHERLIPFDESHVHDYIYGRVCACGAVKNETQ